MNLLVFTSISVLLFLPHVDATPGCVLRWINGVEKSSVCVCNSTYCDEIEPLGTIQDGQAVVYTTDINGQRMDRSTVKITSTPGEKVITFDALNLHQTIKGFGGAFTDAVGINLLDLSREGRELLLKQYYGTTGTEYTLGRIPITSTDFGLKEYSCLDTPGDFNLDTFALQPEDYKYKLPFIKRAMELSKPIGGLKFFASVWSAPAWMKSNNQMVGGGRLRGFEGGPYYVTWAKYFVKFLEAYDEEGVNFWAVTPQNEPTTGSDPNYRWQTMYFSPKMEQNFVRDQLGPILRNSSVGKNMEIIMLDDMRETLPMWADVVLEDPEASKYIAGIGVHYYQDFVFPVSALSTTHEKHPDKYILATEACEGFLEVGEGVSLGDYSRGEAYAHSIIEDLNNWVVGWMDWNLCLNPGGGPTFVNNIVDSPIIVEKESGEFLKQPMYYALAHFTKFLKPGSQRATVILPVCLPDQVFVLGALMNDGRRFMALLNRNSHENVTLSITDIQHPGQYINVDLPSRSMKSIVWNE